jgi:hypothetical protein
MTEEHDVVSVERYLWDEPPRVKLLKMPREAACLIRAEHVDSEDEELGSCQCQMGGPGSTLIKNVNP